MKTIDSRVKNNLLDALMILLVPVLIIQALLTESYREEANGKFLLFLVLTTFTLVLIGKLYSRYVTFFPKK